MSKFIRTVTVRLTTVVILGGSAWLSALLVDWLAFALDAPAVNLAVNLILFVVMATTPILLLAVVFGLFDKYNLLYAFWDEFERRAKLKHL